MISLGQGQESMVNKASSPGLSLTFPLLSIRHHGGVGVIIYLANYLAHKGWKVNLVTAKDKFKPHYFISGGVRVLLTPKVGRLGLFSHLLVLLYLFLWLPKSDLIIANFFPTFYPSYLRSRLGYGRLLYLIQGYEARFCGFPLSLLVSLSYRLKSSQVVVSGWLRDQLKGNPPVINPGPRAGFFPDKADSLLREKGTRKAVVYLWSSPKRGRVSLLREVMKDWRRDDLELWIVGGSPKLRTKLRTRFFPLLGQDELRRVYSSADTLLHTSHYEGFGLPPLEAMACGTPPVLTDSGGVREYARDGYNCLLVEKDPLRIREAVETLLVDDELREKLTKGALKTAARFSMEKMAEEFEELLHKVIG